MTTLTAWAARHAITPTAYADLIQMLGLAVPVDTPQHTGKTLTTEAEVQSWTQIEHARRTGGRLLRNNSGAFKDETGRLVRYGLGHQSAAINKIMKSSDLIGPTPIVCPCGHRYGVFTAYEAKHPGWTYQGDKPCRCKPGKPLCVPCHEKAQLAFGKLVVSLGGIFQFVQGGEL
jgi:hypothetical protein